MTKLFPDPCTYPACECAKLGYDPKFIEICSGGKSNIKFLDFYRKREEVKNTK